MADAYGRDPDPYQRRRMAGGTGWMWVVAAVILAVIVAAVIWAAVADPEEETVTQDAPGLAEDGTAGVAEEGADAEVGASISEITSQPEDFVGQTVTLSGEAAELNDIGFLLEETDALQGDDIWVITQADMMGGIDEGSEVTVTGSVETVDEDTYAEVGDQFFDDLSFDDVEGQAIIRAQNVSQE